MKVRHGNVFRPIRVFASQGSGRRGEYEARLSDYVNQGQQRLRDSVWFGFVATTSATAGLAVLPDGCHVALVNFTNYKSTGDGCRYA